VEIKENKKDAVVLLELKGRLDASTSPKFQKKILSVIEGGEKNLVIDFSDLDYISSAGLRVLLLGAKKLQSVDGKIVLACLADHVKEVFDIAGFSVIFPFYDATEDAIKSFE